MAKWSLMNLVMVTATATAMDVDSDSNGGESTDDKTDEDVDLANGKAGPHEGALTGDATSNTAVLAYADSDSSLSSLSSDFCDVNQETKRGEDDHWCDASTDIPALLDEASDISLSTLL